VLSKRWTPWLLLAAWLLSAASLSAPKAAVAETPAIAVIVHRANPNARISATMLKQLFTGQLLFWPTGGPVVPINFPPGDPLRVAFDYAVLGMSPERAGEFWVDQLVRVQARPPRKLASPSLALRVVMQLPSAIAYLPASMATADVRVVATIKGKEVVLP
jgi:hypothetical protein